MTDLRARYELAKELACAAGELLASRFRTRLDVSFKSDRSLVSEVDTQAEALITDGIRKAFPEDRILAEEAESMNGRQSGQAWREGDFAWVIDPLDGTTNFIHGYPFFCTSIGGGLVRADGTIDVQLGAIRDPLREVTYHGLSGHGAFRNETKMQVATDTERGESFLVTGFYLSRGPDLRWVLDVFASVSDEVHAVRRDGSAALNLAMVADGIFHGFWEAGLKPWDLAAGCLLIRESGGYLRNYPGHQGTREFDIDRHGVVAGNATTTEFLMEMLT